MIRGPCNLAGPVLFCRGRLVRTRAQAHLSEMIEVNWGRPLKFVVTDRGDIQSFSTIESARYWLRRKWPVCDSSRDLALSRIEDAMDCLGPVETARTAFIQAAEAAGFRPAV